MATATARLAAIFFALVLVGWTARAAELETETHRAAIERTS